MLQAYVPRQILMPVAPDLQLRKQIKSLKGFFSTRYRRFRNTFRLVFKKVNI